MERHPGDDEADAQQVRRGGHLAEHDQADNRGSGGQQGEHEREGGARQPGHGELVGHVGDHRRAHAHPSTPQQPGRVAEGRGRAADSSGGDRYGRDQHRHPELVNRPASWA